MAPCRGSTRARTRSSPRRRSGRSSRWPRGPARRGRAPRERRAAGTLPASVCTDESPAGKADVLIASDLPLQGDRRRHGRAARDGRRDPDRPGRARLPGRASTPSATDRATTRPRRRARSSRRRCAANANAYASADRVVAVIGPYNSGCAGVELPILNSAPGGPLAVISPTNTDVGLTQHRGAAAGRGRAERPRSTTRLGTRHFVRLTSPDNLMGAAEAMLAGSSASSASTCSMTATRTWKAIIVDPFRQTARRRRRRHRRLDDGSIPTAAKRLRRARRRVERSGADGVLFAVWPVPARARAPDGRARAARATRADAWSAASSPRTATERAVRRGRSGRARRVCADARRARVPRSR